LKVGLYQDGLWLVDWNGDLKWDATDDPHTFNFGLPGDLPVAGKWQ
jgi:hypothetical protein